MRIAIVCMEFTGAVGPARMRSLAEGLALAGHDVLFVTSEGHATDQQFRVVCIPFARIGLRLKTAVGLNVDDSLAVAARRRGQLLEGLLRAAAHTYETLTQYPDKHRQWIHAVRRWVRSSPQELRELDVVLATSPPATSLYCGLAIARHAGVPVLFDFRDMWTSNPYYPFALVRRSLDRIAERRLVAQAAAITCATATFRGQLALGCASTPVRSILTGIDPTPWQIGTSREPDQQLRIGHFGSTYAGRRSLLPLLESFRRLSQSAQIDLSCLSIELFGDTDETTLAAARDRGVSDSLATHGWIPQSEVIAALGTIDVALLLVWSHDLASIPLKTYHYLAAGKTILLLGAHADSEVRSLLEPLPGVDCPQTPGELDACILRYWNMATAGADFSWTLETRPLPVTRETMTAQFLEVFRQVVS